MKGTNHVFQGCGPTQRNDLVESVGEFNDQNMFTVGKLLRTRAHFVRHIQFPK